MRNILLTLLAVGALIGSIILVRRTRAEAAGTLPGNTGGNGLPSGGGNTGGGNNPLPGNTGGNSGGGSGLNYNVVLSYTSGVFSNRAEVKELQLMLNRVEVANPLVVDGMFGPKTEAKLKRLNNGFGQITLGQAKTKWPFA